MGLLTGGGKKLGKGVKPRKKVHRRPADEEMMDMGSYRTNAMGDAMKKNRMK